MGLPSHKVRLAKPGSAGVYVRHRPETTLLYQIVQEYWPEFQAELASHGKTLPAYVTKEFDEYLKCGRLEHGFLRVRCESCHDEKLVAFSCKRHIPPVSTLAEVAGFSLHAGIATKTNERAKLERLCRYITRPAVSTKRLSLTRNGRVRYELKTPWRNGTTHIIFEPLDFISRLVTLVPRPRVNLTRFHGVFAPNSKYRARVTPTRRSKRKTIRSPDVADQTPAEKRASMNWAQRLKRVFGIDIETCGECGGNVKIIASIEDPAVIQKILAHLDDNATSAATGLLPDCRASPTVGLFV